MRSRTTALALLAVAGSMVACDSQPKQTQSVDAMPRPAQRRAPIERVNALPVSQSLGVLSGSAMDGARLLTTQTLRAPSQGPVEADGEDAEDPAQGELRDVRYAAREAPAEDVIRVLVGELLERPYVIASGVQGEVTLDIDRRMSTREIERLLSALASAFGWTVQERDGMLVFSGAGDVATAPEAPVLEGDAAFPGDAPAVRVFDFDHVAPADAQKLVADLTNNATAKAIAVGRFLVVAERTEQLARLAALFNAVDQPTFDGVEIWTFELSHVRPDQAVETLTAIGQSAGLDTDTVAFVELPGAPRLMVISKDASAQPIVRRWLRQIDQPAGDQRVQRWVYRIQHMPAEALESTLRRYYEGRAVFSGRQQNQRNAPADAMRITVAGEAEKVFVEATPEQYGDLLKFLKVLDHPPQQAQLQAIIAEVTLTDALEYGVEYFLSVQTGSGSLELLGDALSLAEGAATGSAFFVGSDGFALIEALDRESDVTVLSTPTITAADGREASIQVGGETPIISSVVESGQTGGTTDLRNQIEYRNTGVTLTVQPQISESGYVTLNISQEILDAVSNQTSGIDSPEFTTRMLETEVVVPHGATVLLGGIIDNNKTQRREAIPILGNLPVVGPLFSSTRDSVERTELIVTITPQIIDDPRSAGPLLGDFLRGARAVESALYDFQTDLPAGAADQVDLPETPDADPPLEEPTDAEDPPPAGAEDDDAVDPAADAEPAADASGPGLLRALWRAFADALRVPPAAAAGSYANR